MNNLKIFACNSSEDFAKNVCEELGIRLGKKEVMKFKNDNTFVRILEPVREDDVFVFQTTLPPVNERIMELLITIDALKRASAKRITAVLPYYIYARSDKKDQPRIPITAKLVADILVKAGADRVLTCDLHNPAIQGFIEVPTDHLKAKDILTAYFRPLAQKLGSEMVVVATDAGSSKNAYKYARRLGTEIALIDKRRNGNDDKAVASHIIGDVKGKTCVIFDDEIDTGGSMLEAVRMLTENGAKEVYAACTHAVLSANAVEKIAKSNLKEVVVTNTIPLIPEKRIDKIKVLDIAPLFGKAIHKIHTGESVGDLFEDHDMEG